MPNRLLHTSNEIYGITLKSARHSASLKRRLQNAKDIYQKGNFTKALHSFQSVSEMATEIDDPATYVEAATYMLRIFAEREDLFQIESIEQKVLKILSTHSIDLSLKSKAMYVLGICACYNPRPPIDYEFTKPSIGRASRKLDEAMISIEAKYFLALQRFRQAIDFALLSGNKEALAAPLYGTATVLYARRQFEDALKELDRLDVLLGCLPVPDFLPASHLLRALTYRNLHQSDDALQSAWKAYESLKNEPHIVMYLHSLCAIASILMQKNEVTSARLYIDLAQKTIQREEFPRLARLIDELAIQLGGHQAHDCDLHFNRKTGTLFSQGTGEIRFDGQFVLRDLLVAFLENPGTVLNKQILSEIVWKEPYDPAVHDNKIYVTIKRLRKVLEKTPSKFELISRAKNGYFLNPRVRVFIDNQLITSKNQISENTLFETEK